MQHIPAHVPPDAAAKASLIAAAVIATGHPRAKTHWPLVVPGMPAGNLMAQHDDVIVQKLTEMLMLIVASYLVHVWFYI